MAAPSTAFVKQYQDTITMLAQQLSSRLRPCVMVDTNWKGEEKYYDQYASDSMVEITGRLQDTPLQDPDHRRRRVTPSHYVSNTLEDPNEALQMLVDPKSAYMQAKMAAAGRRIDSTVIAALGGTAYSGKAGATSNTLASAQKVTAGSTGLTQVKLRAAAKALNKNEAPKEDRYLIFNSEALDDILATTEATSSDFNTVKSLVQGDIDTFMGFKFVRTELLTTDGTSRLLYAFQKTGIQLAIQKEATGRITERPDKNYGWQVYLSMALGAVRLDENMVCEIAITE